MDLACSPRVPVDAASSQLCRDGGSQWARRLQEPGVSVCPLAPVQVPPWIFGPPGSAPIRSRRCSSPLS
ncbi:hypothetical protein NDU88_005011 [Pleurodeles waltl]|uniref:Uncharacterized protein n=1 Tax=Pleurodeles waltl TaxID=8319 RepID=A0AAV7WAA5_PLEWA|nr:hypothetical protein NDU88_005011 [Pleurodeles waltl]